jgi:hypothetical protein
MRLVAKSLVFGWLVQVLQIVFFFAIRTYGVVLPELMEKVLFWNIRLVFWIMGSPILLYISSDGRPVYEGTPADGIYFLSGIVLGLIVYPAVILLGLRSLEFSQTKFMSILFRF